MQREHMFHVFSVVVLLLLCNTQGTVLALSVQDPVELCLTVEDLPEGYILDRYIIAEGPVEAAENLIPYDEEAWRSRGFEKGIHRYFENEEQRIRGVLFICAVNRYTSVNGARSELQYKYDFLIQQEIPIEVELTKNFGDECFELEVPGIAGYSGRYLFIYFRKGNMYVEVIGPNKNLVHMLAHEMEERIEISILNDPTLPIIVLGGGVGIILLIFVIKKKIRKPSV